MRKLMMICLPALCFVAGACDDDDNNNGNSLQLADERFVENASLSNMTEIEFGSLAATRGESEMVKSYGQAMITEHTKAQQELKGIADQYKNVNWPQQLDAQHQQMKQQLMAMSGRMFDSAYIQSQVMDHEMTLTIFENELDSGKNASVRAYATKYRPHIEEHLEKADSILSVILTTADSN